jgi:4-hydroxy-tetrahydrodipicolinate synthase
VSIKEAGGSPERVSLLRKQLPREFTILSGDDPQTLPFMAVGATGVVSVASNIIPREVVQLVAAFRKGHFDEALNQHLHWYPLFKDLFLESNPIPVKAALHLLGWIEPEYRLPLCEMAPSNLERLRRTLATLGLL